MSHFRQQMHSEGQRNILDNISLDLDSAMIYKCENIEDMPIAMAYVPWQHWKNVYDLDKALEIGTIFPELDLPFCGMRGERSW